MPTHKTRKSMLWIQVLLPITIIRFAVLYPMICYWIAADKHKNLIERHVELHNGTYTAILTGEKIGAKWAYHASMWTFAASVPSLIFLPPLNLPFAVVDTIITVHISIATHYQTGFNPHRKADCRDVRYLPRPAGVNENFFEAAARLDGKEKWDSRYLCIEFVEQWRYGIALSVLCACISFIGIVSFLRSVRDAKKQSQDFPGMLKSFFRDSVICSHLLGTLSAMFVACLLYYIPRSLFRCLPLSMKAPIRSGRRYASKAVLGAKRKAETIGRQRNVGNVKSQDASGKYQVRAGEQTPLAQFLGVYDMLMLVTEHLHYVEVMNLSCVSKSVRQSVLPSQDLPRSLAALKRYACGPEHRDRCWTCKNQTCGDCQQLSPIPQTNTLHHMDKCRPVCTPCYNTQVVRSKVQKKPDRPKSLDPWCDCAPPPPRGPNGFLRYVNGAWHYAHAQRRLPKYARPTCRQCAWMSSDELLSLREKRTKMLLKRGMNAEGVKWTKCSNVDCGRELGTGPRWWICKEDGCKKECTDTIHEPWEWERKENGHDAHVVGEEAV